MSTPSIEQIRAAREILAAVQAAAAAEIATLIAEIETNLRRIREVAEVNDVVISLRDVAELVTEADASLYIGENWNYSNC